MSALGAVTSSTFFGVAGATLLHWLFLSMALPFALTTVLLLVHAIRRVWVAEHEGGSGESH